MNTRNGHPPRRTERRFFLRPNAVIRLSVYPREGKELIRRLSIIAATAAIMVGLAAPVAHAGNVTNQHFDLSTSAVNTCNGESILITGMAHLVENETGDGGFLGVFSVHGTGTGSDGNEYILNETQTITFNSSGFRLTRHVVLVSQGSAPNRHLTATISSPPFAVTFDEDCVG